MKYWIALSNWYQSNVPEREESGALDREREKKWWYLEGRDNPSEGDKAIIYQPGSTEQAEGEGVIIEDRFKTAFIGNFTVGRIIDNQWVEIVRDKILWDTNIIKLNDLKNSLNFINKNNVGSTFWHKTWIEINKHDYDLIMQRARQVRI